MTQKQTAKFFSFINGQEIIVYTGRVKSNMKHVEYELSVKPKVNRYGAYEEISITIQKTHFNGKVITIMPKYFSCGGFLTFNQ